MAEFHFDTASILKEMEASFSSLPSGETEPEEFQAVSRHRDITIALARMALEEANRGSDPDFIIWMLAHFCAEFLDNMANLTEADLKENTSSFLEHLLDCVRQTMNGTATVDASVVLREIKGGHA